MTPEEITAQISRLDRGPFQELLSLFLTHPPNSSSIQDLADSDPKKYAEAVKLFANLSGYHDRQEILLHQHIAVLHMSDIEIEEQLSRLGCSPSPKLFPHLIEHEPEIDPDPETENER